MQDHFVSRAAQQGNAGTQHYSLIQAGVFCLIQLAWLPIAIVAYSFFVLKLVIFSRRSGVSSTTLASLYTRWMQHQLGTRSDEPVVRLMPILPNVSPLALQLVTAGTLQAHRLTGYVPRIYRYPYRGTPVLHHEGATRTTFFDLALARHLEEIEQLVVLGAGYDTRSYRMPEEIHCFEVDLEKNQRMKRKMLEKAGLDATRITFVPTDFMRENWFENLVQAGFDPGKRTFFLWEGVTMYLDEGAVTGTLRAIATTAKGSAVSFDYLRADLIKSQTLFWRYARAVANFIGEPLRFGIETTTPSSQSIAAFLESCDLTMEEQRNFESESNDKPAMAGFTTAIV